MNKRVVVVEKLNRIGKITNSYTFGPYAPEAADKVKLSLLGDDRNVFIEVLLDPATVNILKDDNAF